ncbi:MAG: hypothetical protein DELT_03019 [Desulfovibrio sp.]
MEGNALARGLSPGTFKHWKRKTVLFLSGQTVSLFGSSLVQFAIIWYITLSTQSGGIMTIASICGFAPQIVISLFSGVWADRVNRKLLIIGADALVASATFILALFFLSGHNDLWMVFLVSGIRSLGSGIQTPAVNAMLPQIVPTDRLTRVGGIFGSLQSVMFILSPAAAGAMLSFTRLEYTFFVDVSTAAVAIVIMILLKVPVHEKAKLKQKGGYLDDLKAGLTYVWGSGFFRSYFLFYALFFFLIVPAAQLTPLMVSRTFGDEYWRLSATEIAFSVGGVIGGIVISAWGGFKNRMYTIALCCILFGILTALVGILPGFITFLVLMVLTGSTVPLFTTPSMVLLQEQVDTNMQGRVFSLTQIIMTSMMPLGMVFFGPLADQVRIETLMLVTGICGAIVGVAIFFNKHFKSGLITG